MLRSRRPSRSRTGARPRTPCRCGTKRCLGRLACLDGRTAVARSKTLMERAGSHGATFSGSLTYSLLQLSDRSASKRPEDAVWRSQLHYRLARFFRDRVKGGGDARDAPPGVAGRFDPRDRWRARDLQGRLSLAVVGAALPRTRLNGGNLARNLDPSLLA